MTSPEAVTLADRVLVIEDGQIALDLGGSAAAARTAALSPEIAALEGRILRDLFRNLKSVTTHEGRV